jgi:uncharacterized membrane protein YdjX (TVP38/TMEM64 family)
MLLLMFIVAAVVLVRYTGVREFLPVEKLGAQLTAAGLWAPLAFILIYAVGVCLFIPGTLLTTLGAAIYGPYWGFVYVWVAAGAFLIGRYLGREFSASIAHLEDLSIIGLFIFSLFHPLNYIKVKSLGKNIDGLTICKEQWVRPMFC